MSPMILVTWPICDLESFGVNSVREVYKIKKYTSYFYLFDFEFCDQIKISKAPSKNSKDLKIQIIRTREIEDTRNQALRAWF